MLPPTRIPEDLVELPQLLPPELEEEKQQWTPLELAVKRPQRRPASPWLRQFKPLRRWLGEPVVPPMPESPSVVAPAALAEQVAVARPALAAATLGLS